MPKGFSGFVSIKGDIFGVVRPKIPGEMEVPARNRKPDLGILIWELSIEIEMRGSLFKKGERYFLPEEKISFDKQ